MDIIGLAAVLLVASCLALLLMVPAWRTIFRRMYLASKIPGPSNWEFYTVILKDLIAERALQILHNLSQIYEYKLFGIWLLHRFVVVINNCESLEHLFKNRAFDHKPNAFYGTAVALYMGNNLITTKGGPEYKTNRKILSKPFRAQKIASCFEKINDEALKFVNQLRDVANGEEVDVRCIAQELFSAITASILASGTIPTEKISPLLKLTSSLSHDAYIKCVIPIYYWLHKLKKYMGMLSPNEETLAQTKKTILEEYTASQRLIGRREEEVDNVLDALAMYPHQFEDDGFSEAKGFLFATQETSYTTLNTALLLLAMYPEVQERIFQEIDFFLGRNGKFLEQQDLPAMVYLERTIKEVLRLFPPVPLILRENDKESAINGTIIPEGSIIVIPIHALHRDPNAFEDPLKFDPERFSPERSKGRHPYAYIPFSMGMRNCPGQGLAMIVLKTTLCHVIKNYKISPGHQYCTVEDIQVKANVTMELCHSSLRFTKRRP